MKANRLPDNQEADALYEQYSKPLEADHWGEYVAIFPQGQTVVGSTVTEVVQNALSTVGRGSVVFKIGEKAVWSWR